MPPVVRLAAVVAGCGMIAACASTPSPAPVPVEVWSRGEDGLSQRLRAAVQAGVAASDRLDSAGPGFGGGNRLVISSVVRQGATDVRGQVAWTARVERGGGRSRDGDGRCREDRLADCAEAIVTLAERGLAD